MTIPKLSVPSSGLSGRGYRNPFTGEVVPGVTTVLGILEKPGIVNWHIENTVAYAVTHVDELLSRTEEAGMRFLQYYTRRLNQDTLDDESINALNYSMGVLDDLANVGNFIHDFIEADINDWFEPEPWRADLLQMANAYVLWSLENSITEAVTERTLFGAGYAGSADGIGTINGVKTLWDNKSSRAIYDSHVGQLAALGACDTMAEEVEEGTEGAVYYKMIPSVAKHHGGQVDSWWVEKPVPEFTQYGVLQVRPDDSDTKGNAIEAFCEFHVIEQDLIEAGWELFQGALRARHGQARLKKLMK